jgi:hypothetical protein
MDRRKHTKIFYLCKNIDSRRLRYYLHKLEEMETVDLETLSKAVSTKKKYKRTLIITEEEERIINKLGKSANLLVNCVLVKADEGEQI